MTTDVGRRRGTLAWAVELLQAACLLAIIGAVEGVVVALIATAVTR